MNLINKRLSPYYILYTLIFNVAAIGMNALSGIGFIIGSLIVAVVLFTAGYIINLKEKEENQ